MAWKQGRKSVQMRACVWARPGPRRRRRAGAPRLDRLHPVSPALGALGSREGWASCGCAGLTLREQDGAGERRWWI